MVLLILTCLGFTILFVFDNPVVSDGFNNPPPQNETSTFTFTIDPGDATVKDVHVTPPMGRILPPVAKDSNGNEMISMPDHWVFYRPQGGASYNFYCGDNGDAIPSTGSTFSISVPAKNNRPPLVSFWTVYFTSDGDKNRNTGLIGDPTTTNAKGDALLGPVRRITACLGPGSRNEAGGYLLINSRAELHGAAYHTYASKSFAETSVYDTLGIGLNMNGIPTGDWITSVEKARGAFQVIDDEGFAQTRLNLNDNPEMEGKTLYVVVTQDLDNDGLPDVFNYPPLEIVLFQN